LAFRLFFIFKLFPRECFFWYFCSSTPLRDVSVFLRVSSAYSHTIFIPFSKTTFFFFKRRGVPIAVPVPVRPVKRYKYFFKCSLTARVTNIVAVVQSSWPVFAVTRRRRRRRRASSSDDLPVCVFLHAATGPDLAAEPFPSDLYLLRCSVGNDRDGTRVLVATSSGRNTTWVAWIVDSTHCALDRSRPDRSFSRYCSFTETGARETGCRIRRSSKHARCHNNNTRVFRAYSTGFYLLPENGWKLFFQDIFSVRTKRLTREFFEPVKFKIKPAESIWFHSVEKTQTFVGADSLKSVLPF